MSAVDVLSGIGWLDHATLKRWQQTQLPSLEDGIQTNLSRISEAMRLFHAWAAEKALDPSETAYVAKTPARPALRFSKSGDATIERIYRTHWVSRDLSAKKPSTGRNPRRRIWRLRSASKRCAKRVAVGSRAARSRRSMASLTATS